MRKRKDACGICGGTEFITAVDNHGKTYEGCARCRVAPKPEVIRTGCAYYDNNGKVRFTSRTVRVGR